MSQLLSAVARPTKGGAVRIRIALTTAVAVCVALSAVLFALLSSTSAASTRMTRHEAGTRYRSIVPSTKLMSYSQAQKVSNLVTYAGVVATQKEEGYLNEVSYLKAVQQKAVAAVAAAQPPLPAAVAPAPSPTGAASDATSTNTPDWQCIRVHESGDNYDEYNGGAYQFELGTWEGLTGLSTPPEDSPPAVQDAAALRLYDERGWEPWTTRYVCGL
jgi:hypothetical protein